MYILSLIHIYFKQYIKKTIWSNNSIFLIAYEQLQFRALLPPAMLSIGKTKNLLLVKQSVYACRFYNINAMLHLLNSPKLLLVSHTVPVCNIHLWYHQYLPNFLSTTPSTPWVTPPLTRFIDSGSHCI